MVRVASFPLVLPGADNPEEPNISFFIEDICASQGASFINAASGVQTDAEQTAIAQSSQPLIEQQLNFLLGQNLGFAVAFEKLPVKSG